MSQGETITHDGIVLRVPGDGTIDVEIITGNACSSCNAKSVCALGDTETRIITVKNNAPLHPGDHVTVVMEQSQGFRALAIGYIIPFIVLIAAFVLLTVTGAGELAAALLSFVVLAVYYLMVWLLRKRIDRRFEFKIKD
jgi:sigma-E factor negative regulatory protein RseC